VPALRVLMNPRPPRPGDESAWCRPIVPPCCWRVDQHRHNCRGGASERRAVHRVWLSESCCSRPASNRRPYSEILGAGPMWRRSAAPRDEVLRMWAELGYYSRARNLHACAVAVVRVTAASFLIPRMACALPGIGPLLQQRSRRRLRHQDHAGRRQYPSAWCRGFTPSRNRFRRPSR
jgi:A/G-specific adenine glycosylase